MPGGNLLEGRIDAVQGHVFGDGHQALVLGHLVELAGRQEEADEFVGEGQVLAVFVYRKFNACAVQEIAALFCKRNGTERVRERVLHERLGLAFAFSGSGNGISGSHHHGNIPFKKAKNKPVIVIGNRLTGLQVDASQVHELPQLFSQRLQNLCPGGVHAVEKGNLIRVF